MKKQLLKTNLLLVIFLSLISYSNAQQTLNPPAQLTAISEIAKPDVSLSWWSPGTPLWLHYDSGLFYAGVGLNEAGEFDVAIAYEASQMTPYVGMGISQFAFVPAESASAYILKIWTGTDADSVIYQDTLKGLTINKWNTITLDSTITIEANRIYYFGYHVNADGGYPAGCDEGPVVERGKSDLIRTQEGPFYSLYDLGVDLNLNIEVYLEPASTKKMTSLITKENSHYSSSDLVLVKLQKAKEPVRMLNATKSVSPDSFIVYRDNEAIGTSTNTEYQDVLTMGGEYVYAVTAVYGTEESAKSNEVKVLYDNKRIPVNVVVTETFINVGTYDVNSMNSPSSPGAFMGIVDLNAEVDSIAPIIYHSGTQILGDDPFSNDFAESRFTTYISQTLSFPMTTFNGNITAGGGSSDNSLYDYYRPLYDSAKAILTPIALDCQLEKITNSTYNLYATIRKVGVYTDKNLVLQVVLTKDKIDYSWDNDKFSQVRFVEQGMFPNENGTSISFVGDTLATKTVGVTIDPLSSSSNYRVVAFVQNKNTLEILNGSILQLPVRKNITFTVVDNNEQPVENASITINDNTVLTSNSGIALFSLYNNIGETGYSIQKDGFYEFSGVFNPDTTENIRVQLIINGIESNLSNGIKVYPNPVSDVLTIESEVPTIAIISTVTGRVVLQQSLVGTSNQIKVSSLQQGVYFLQLINANNRICLKLVKP